MFKKVLIVMNFVLIVSFSKAAQQVSECTVMAPGMTEAAMEAALRLVEERDAAVEAEQQARAQAQEVVTQLAQLKKDQEVNKAERDALLAFAQEQEDAAKNLNIRVQDQAKNLDELRKKYAEKDKALLAAAEQLSILQLGLADATSLLKQQRKEQEERAQEIEKLRSILPDKPKGVFSRVAVTTQPFSVEDIKKEDRLKKLEAESVRVLAKIAEKEQQIVAQQQQMEAMRQVFEAQQTALKDENWLLRKGVVDVRIGPDGEPVVVGDESDEE